MKIILHSTLAGPHGVRQAGLHDLPAEEAQGLIDGGYADKAPDNIPEGAVVMAPEHATLPLPKGRKAPPVRVVSPAPDRPVDPGERPVRVVMPGGSSTANTTSKGPGFDIPPSNSDQLPPPGTNVTPAPASNAVSIPVASNGATINPPVVMKDDVIVAHDGK